MHKHLNRGRGSAYLKPVMYTLAGTLLGGGMTFSQEVRAEGFIDDSTLTGGV